MGILKYLLIDRYLKEQLSFNISLCNPIIYGHKQTEENAERRTKADFLRHNISKGIQNYRDGRDMYQ